MISERTTSPAQTSVLGVDLRGRYGHPNEIDDDLILSRPLQRVDELRGLVADDDDLGSVDQLIERRTQKRREMRDLLADVGSVCADQSCECDVPVIDLERQALAEELLCEDHDGTLAQIVG